MPVIFTLVSFWSHESIHHASRWIGRRAKNSPDSEPPQAEDAEESQVAEQPGWRALSLQWSVVALAFFAFAVSLYSLTHEPDATVTVLREKVIETVTVTSEPSRLSVAKSNALVPTVTTAQSGGGAPTTTTTLPKGGQTESTSTTVSTLPGSVTTTSLP